MDIDDNDAQDQNLQLVGEGSSKVSSALNPYVLPKFEFDDSLQGHLRFDSLVDNEVFLGITSQEDNQWIEEYSRGTSSIQFSSSVVESTHKNVWSEATSLESVEMLLKSVGQEEKVVEETPIEELDACDRRDSVNNIMDSTLRENIVEPKLRSDCKQSHATLESQCQEIQFSVGELDSVVRGEQITNKIGDDVHQEAIKLANESPVNELLEDPSFSKVECANAGSSQNFDASAEKSQEDLQIPETGSENAGQPEKFESSKPDHIMQNEENNMENSTNSGIVVEIGTFSVEKLSVVSNVEGVDKQPAEGSIPICKEPTASLSLASCGMQINEDCNAQIGSAEKSECSNSAVSDSQICSKVDQEVIDNMHGVSLEVFPTSACAETQATEDADMKIEVSELSKCNVGSLSSLSHLHSHSVEETENDVGGDDKFEMGESLAVSLNSGCVPTQATEDVDMQLEVSDFPKYNIGSLSSPSHSHSLSVEETENGGGSDGKSEMVEALAVSSNGGCVATQATEDVDTQSKISDYEKSNVGSLSSPSNLHNHAVVETEIGAGSAGVAETVEAFAASPKSGSVTTQATEDVNTKSEIFDYQKSNVTSVSSPSHLHRHTVEETENGAESPGISEMGETLAVSPNSGCASEQTIIDADRKPEIFDFPKDNVSTLSSLPRLDSSVKEAENDVGIDGKYEIREGSEINDVGKTLLSPSSLAEMPARSVSDKPEISGNNVLNAHTVEIIVDSQIKQGGDETQLSEPNTITKGQETIDNKRQDGKSSLHFRDMDIDTVGSPDSQRVVEPSSSFEGCEGAISTGQRSESITTVLTGAAAAVESSKISSTDTMDGLQLPSVTVSAADVSEDQPRSPPIPGPSLLHSDNEEKVELGSSQIGTTSVGAEKVVHELAVHCDPLGGNLNASPSGQDNLGGHTCSKTLDIRALPCNFTAKGDHKPDEECLMAPQESITGEDGVESLNLEVNTSSEQQTSSDLAGPSELAIKHEVHRDGAALSNNPEVFSMLETKNVESSENLEVVQQATKGNMYENSPLSMASKDDVRLQTGSPVSETKEATIFSFDVNASDGQNRSLLKNTKVSSASSCGSQLDPIILSEDILASPQPPSVAASETGAKVVSERKSRRQSAGTVSAKKGNQLKQTTSTRRSRKGEKLSASLNSPASGDVTPLVKDLKSSESIECSNPKPGPVRPISLPILPDLNSSAHLFQQSFTDNQQLQLRAQIFVYGSLISGVPPEEPHMIAAFGQSDGGRTLWEGAWHACLERIHPHKSIVNNLSTPMQSRSDLGNRDSEQGIKVGPAQSKVMSSPIVSPMIPVSSPLWNVATPYDGSQSNAMPRTHFLDNRPALSPLHPYQPPHVQSIAGHHPSWPSQGPLPGHWVPSSPVTPFSARLSALPITESVKLTTVKESGIPGIPVDPRAGSSVSSGPSSVSNVKKAMVLSGQPLSDSKSRKRKKVSTSQAEVASLSAPVTHLSWGPRTEGYNQISFLAQSQTISGTPVVVASHSSTSASLSSPLPIISTSTHGDLSHGDQNMEKIVTTKDIESKIEESKVQALDAAVHAATAVSHCQSLWSQLEIQKSSGLISDDEAKLASSAVSIAAASSVAKVAAAAAKIASNVAEQAKLMADEVFRSSRTESNTISLDKASSVISAAREAARRRIEAASAASKHAENLDAIVKAAELAAEAVSQAGKIVSMGNPLPIKDLLEAGPEGYWKTQLSNQQGHSEKRSIETAANDKEFQTLKHGGSLQEGPGDMAKKQMINIDGISGSSTFIENGKSIVSGHKCPDLSKMVGSELGSVSSYNVDHSMPQGTSGTWKENIIREGSFVEVYKDDDKNKGAWFAANVLTLKDGKAFVSYTEIQSDDGSGTLKEEWVPLEAEASEAPRIRIAHPITTMKVERSRKRGRTAITDYAWCSGDRIDVWVQDRWCEAVVVETNRIDLTSLTVQFPAQEKMSVVRSWHVRPPLIWKDGKWIESSSLKGCRSSEGETPHEKRQKIGDSILENKEKAKASSIVIDLVDAGKHQDSSALPSSVHGSSFDIGKSSKVENKLDTHRTMKKGMQKDRSRVVFGVPKPGKKQKFMDVSRHYVPNDPVKPASHSMARGSKDDPKNDAKEKQVAEVKPKALKSRKPPIPLIRPLAQKDKSKTSKHMSRDDEYLPGHQNQMDFGSSSDTEDGRETSTSKASQRSNKRKIAPGDRKANKVEVRDTSTSEAEPRRSNRRIQPTSRLLEGLQSSLSLPKTPSVSHASQRSHNKVTPKGSTNPR